MVVRLCLVAFGGLAICALTQRRFARCMLPAEAGVPRLVKKIFIYQFGRSHQNLAPAL